MLHLELDVAGSGMQYNPGDSVGVLPENSDALVDGVLQRLGVAKGGVIAAIEPAEGEGGGGGALLPHIRCPCTVRTAFKVGAGGGGRWVGQTGCCREA